MSDFYQFAGKPSDLWTRCFHFTHKPDEFHTVQCTIASKTFSWNTKQTDIMFGRVHLFVCHVTVPAFLFVPTRLHSRMQVTIDYRILPIKGALPNKGAPIVWMMSILS